MTDFDNDMFAKYQMDIETKNNQLDLLKQLQADGQDMNIAIQATQSKIKEIVGQINNMFVQKHPQTIPNPQPTSQNFANAASGQQMPNQAMGAATPMGNTGFNANAGNQLNQGRFGQQNLGNGQPFSNQNTQFNQSNNIQFDQNQQPQNQNMGYNQPNGMNQNQGFQRNTSNQPQPQLNEPQNTDQNQFKTTPNFGQQKYNFDKPSSYDPMQQNNQFNPQNNTQSNQFGQPINPNQGQQNNMAQNIGGQNPNQFNQLPQQANVPFQTQPQNVPQNYVAPPNDKFNFGQYNPPAETHAKAVAESFEYDDEVKGVDEQSGSRDIEVWNIKFRTYAVSGDMSTHPGIHPVKQHRFNKDEDEFYENYRKYKNIEDD